ncbi:uncharacterized protein LOC124636503 [Helicoverpa zea]|uniref:uncharacterized protein LOC124636503 n=1 Tax=Helicoverpa zea TaxID=7113 RepID=UPI001F570410|nr:uncharacterized protein LOC124636503 [Helicoverpa zea]
MEGFCRGCLIKYNEPMELLQYTEKNRRLFVYSTGLQVKRNDTFTFQLCKDCFLNMKAACKFKKLCRTSDKRFRNYLAIKDVGDPLDFCTFLKNSDDTLTFRLPMTSGSSTPANQKCRDDDNESTCTSIRNFMTDILQGEEMPDTEARIIKEVIEEEADVLDDSLDSHWLQDDMSIDTDFRLDFSFSPFSTPRTVNNDRCYTPKKYVEQKEEQINFYSVNTEKQSEILKDFTDAFKNNDVLKGFELDKVNHIDKSEHNEKQINTFDIDEIDGKYEGKSKTDINNRNNLKELCNYGLDDIDGVGKSVNNSVKQNQKLKELLDLSLDNIDSIDKPDSCTNKTNQSLGELCDLSLSNFDDSERSESNTFKDDRCIKQLSVFEEINAIGKSVRGLELPNLSILDKTKINVCPTKDVIGSIQPAEISNSSINIEALLKDKPCTIDRNLEEALKNTDNKEFSLDDLLVSPPVYQQSAASTPTINNILFGEKLDIVTTNNINPKIGQCIETYDNVQGDIEIFEEFFQNDTKEFELDDIKKGNGGFKSEIDQGTSVLENGTVDNKENEIMMMDVDIPDVNKLCTDNNDHIPESTTENTVGVVSSTTENQIFDIETTSCNLCNKQFRDERSLFIHLTKKHNIKVEKPKQKRKRGNKTKLCNKCGKEINDSSANYSRHVKKCGEPQQTFKCNRCLEEFKSETNLKKHMTSHTNMKPLKIPSKNDYVCTICGTSMNRLSNFTLHMRRHTKDYSATCKVCGKGFYRQSELVTHMRQHTGETPYSCRFCPRLFTRKDVLTRHVLIHLNERLFECDYCGWKCFKKYDLRRHLQCCMRKRGKLPSEKNMADDKKENEQITVIYTTGDDTAIKKQLPFIETELSN